MISEVFWRSLFSGCFLLVSWIGWLRMDLVFVSVLCVCDFGSSVCGWGWEEVSGRDRWIDCKLGVCMQCRFSRINRNFIYR